MKLARFEDLTVWQKAEELSVDIYRVSERGAFTRDFALRDQIRRAVISVMSNIAEGFERYSRTRELNSLSAAEFAPLYERCLEISRMLASLHASTAKQRR